MPPLRPGRASKACDLCHKHKTRCYPSEDQRGCLRCRTLSQTCSLDYPGEDRRSSLLGARQRKTSNGNAEILTYQVSTNERLDRLEKIVGALVDRLDSRLNDLAGGGSSIAPSRPRSNTSVVYAPELDSDPAPVILIRDAATDAGVHSQGQSYRPVSCPDVITAGLVSRSTARSLLALFQTHYGRWVRFPEQASTDTLLRHVKQSPLLLCSILLIAVRHTTQELADKLAPRLFEEAKRLITSSLLEMPQSIGFFQSALILSLWSTTIGQVPLSIDSWLLTGYALQKAFISPQFASILGTSTTQMPNEVDLDSWCLWNHLSVAHLQYCVGTGRPSLLNQTHIDRCLELSSFVDITNYESRMAAEVGLYWIIYIKCNNSSEIDLSATEAALKNWHQEWADLFNEPRSQFLQMGFHFAHLLARRRYLRVPRSVMHTSVLEEMIRHSKAIIQLAIDTADDRTRHLTDHIYHIVTFSALTLCRIIHTYEPKLRNADYDVNGLENLVFTLIGWLRSIGLPCHAANILGDIVSSQFVKMRPSFRPVIDAEDGLLESDGPSVFTMTTNGYPPLAVDNSLLYPNFIGSEMFNLDDGLESWPEWAQISDTDNSV